MSANGFLERLLGRDVDRDDSGTYYSSEEIGTRGARRGAPKEGQQPRSSTIEHLAGVIADLPSTVPWQSAVLVVRKTLDAAGVKLSEVDASARALESKLSSEIELAQDRQKEFREKTQEAVRSLEEEIRKARETCEDVVAYEERKISRDRALLENARRVRAFFEFPDTEREDTGPAEQGTQQLLEPSDVERRQISDTPSHAGGSGQEL
ncbi:MAG: hypothetical protein M3283_14430 [Actinomycetota bacterium]|nr:hypothetical protein [Actinomycetota bacterium]